MTRHPSAQDRALRSAAGLLLFMLCFVLSATNGIAQARSNSLISSIAEKRANGLKVSFTYSPKYPLEGQPVQFADASTGTPGSWQWDFGDGSGSTERNPVHVYSVCRIPKDHPHCRRQQDIEEVDKNTDGHACVLAGNICLQSDNPRAGPDGAVRRHNGG